jgi:hypothetical protein
VKDVQKERESVHPDFQFCTFRRILLHCGYKQPLKKQTSCWNVEPICKEDREEKARDAAIRFYHALG